MLGLVYVGFLGCSSEDGQRRVGDQICRALGDRLEVRLRAHEADIPQLRATAAADARTQLRFSIGVTANDFFATQQLARLLGAGCAGLQEPTCTWRPHITLDGEPDAAMADGRLLLDGFRSQGACAARDRRQRRGPDCRLIAMNMLILDGDVDIARDGWTTPYLPDGMPTKRAGRGASLMAEWRALIDYGLAVAPVCVPRLAAGCEPLRDGLADAPPEELARRLHTLRAAYDSNTPCTPLAPAPPPGRSASSGDAQSPEQ